MDFAVFVNFVSLVCLVVRRCRLRRIRRVRIGVLLDRYRPGKGGAEAWLERFAGEARARNLRISAIGAWYQNPFAPGQEEAARAVWHRAIEVAARLGLPLDHATAALERLALAGHASHRVTDAGVIVYHFHDAHHIEGKSSARDILDA